MLIQSRRGAITPRRDDDEDGRRQAKTLAHQRSLLRPGDPPRRPMLLLAHRKVVDVDRAVAVRLRARGFLDNSDFHLVLLS